MDMTRFLLVAMLIAACDKPTPENCRKALLNMQHLMGTDTFTTGNGGIEGEVRRCRGGSTKKAVECAMAATSLDELRKCDFYKVTDVPASAPGGGAGSAPAGSGSAK
jgi:hypothetical protein